MFVGIDHGLAGNAIEVGCGRIVIDMERALNLQPAGYLPDFPVDQILERAGQPG